MSYYFEDFHTGQEIPVGSVTVTEQEIIDFATQFDPQPFHIDHEAAKASHFGGIVASGWHTCGLIMRLMVDGLLKDSGGMGSPGLDGVRWLLPVRPGDTLSVVCAITNTKASNSRPDRGVIWTSWRATNQLGELVCTIDGMSMFKRRGAHA
ncbi:MAG: MaoC family dehydratase [Pseudomonadota bacterium]